MTLRVGTVLQERYRLLGMLGGGGMGEVYRAVDQKLERMVAIKRLPPTETNDERRRRFEREARAISQLSHPNICALHDVLELDGELYLVMEFLEGENLEERLQRGPMPPHEVVQMGLGIASGLAKAHAQGLVHRDLKPANIMLTDGGPVLLDFGVAKTMRTGEEGTRAGGGVLGDGTLTSVGMVLGTVQYMSPEQLQGKDLDGRSDLFSFGAVLYEATSGHKAFDGDTQADWIAAILRSHPQPVRDQMDDVPEDLAAVIEALLEKDPANRLPSAADLVERLRPLAASLEAGDRGAAETPTSSSRGPLFVAVAAVLVLLAFVVWQLAGPRAEDGAGSNRELRRIPMSLPDWAPLPIPGAFDNTLALSPDGGLLVWVAEIDGVRHLVRRQADSLEAERIEGTRNARQPFFSPDGEWIGYFTLPGGKLMRVLAAPGSDEPPLEIARATLPLGGAWGRDGTIYFWSEFGVGLQKVAASGGVAQEVIPLDAATGELGHAHPQILRGGEVILYSSVFGQDVDLARVIAYEVATGQRTELVQGAIRPRYLDDRVLVFAQKGKLSVAPFDEGDLVITAPARELEEPNLATADSVPVQYAFASDGSFVYVPISEKSGRGRTLARLSFAGEVTPIDLAERPFLSLRWSPAAQRAVVGLEDLLDLWLWSGGDQLERLTTDPKLDFGAVWSPDGRSLAFSSTRATGEEERPASGLNIFRLDLDSGAPPSALTRGEQGIFTEDWSPDGRYLLLNRASADGGADLVVLDLQDGGLRDLVRTAAPEGNADISADGSWMVFASEETGEPEIYLQQFRPGDRAARVRWQVSRGGGNQPVFAPDAQRFFYRQGNAMWEAELRPNEDPPFSTPRVLFEQRFYRHGSEGRSYDVDEDGFLVFLEAPRRGAELILVQGLLAQLAQHDG